MVLCVIFSSRYNSQGVRDGIPDRLHTRQRPNPLYEALLGTKYFGGLVGIIPSKPQIPTYSYKHVCF